LLFFVYTAASVRRIRARLRSKRSIRQPVASLRACPVYAGWQLEQTSTASSARFDRVLNSLPHAQRTVISTRSG
jgi:DNA-directed RNA polymerase specialized sigma24 family protein